MKFCHSHLEQLYFIMYEQDCQRMFGNQKNLDKQKTAQYTMEIQHRQAIMITKSVELCGSMEIKQVLMMALL